MINIPKKLLKDRVETVFCAVTLKKNGKLLVHAGKRYLRLRPADLAHYVSSRGKRGRKLPRGFQQVRAVEIE